MRRWRVVAILLLFWLAQGMIFVTFTDCAFSEGAYAWYVMMLGLDFAGLFSLSMLFAGLVSALLMIRAHPRWPAWVEAGGLAQRLGLLALAVLLSGLYALVYASAPVFLDSLSYLGAQPVWLSAQIAAHYPWAALLPLLAWAAYVSACAGFWRRFMLDGVLSLLFFASLLFSLYVAGLFASLLMCCEVI
jgi:hypothetical protein